MARYVNLNCRALQLQQQVSIPSADPVDGFVLHPTGQHALTFTSSALDAWVLVPQHDGFVHTGRVPLRSGVRVHSGYCCVPLDLFVVVVTTPWQGGSSQLLCFDFDLHPVPLCDIELYHSVVTATAFHHGRSELFTSNQPNSTEPTCTIKVWALREVAGSRHSGVDLARKPRRQLRAPMRRAATHMRQAVTALCIDESSQHLFGWGGGMLHAWSALSGTLLWVHDACVPPTYGPVTILHCSGVTGMNGAVPIQATGHTNVGDGSGSGAISTAVEDTEGESTTEVTLVGACESSPRVFVWGGYLVSGAMRDKDLASVAASEQLLVSSFYCSPAMVPDSQEGSATALVVPHKPAFAARAKWLHDFSLSSFNADADKTSDVTDEPVVLALLCGTSSRPHSENGFAEAVMQSLRYKQYLVTTQRQSAIDSGSISQHSDERGSAAHWGAGPSTQLSRGRRQFAEVLAEALQQTSRSDADFAQDQFRPDDGGTPNTLDVPSIDAAEPLRAAFSGANGEVEPHQPGSGYVSPPSEPVSTESTMLLSPPQHHDRVSHSAAQPSPFADLQSAQATPSAAGQGADVVDADDAADDIQPRRLNMDAGDARTKGSAAHLPIVDEEVVVPKDFIAVLSSDMRLSIWRTLVTDHGPDAYTNSNPQGAANDEENAAAAATQPLGARFELIASCQLPVLDGDGLEVVARQGTHGSGAAQSEESKLEADRKPDEPLGTSRSVHTTMDAQASVDLDSMLEANGRESGHTDDANSTYPSQDTSTDQSTSNRTIARGALQYMSIKLPRVGRDGSTMWDASDSESGEDDDSDSELALSGSTHSRRMLVCAVGHHILAVEIAGSVLSPLTPHWMPAVANPSTAAPDAHHLESQSVLRPGTAITGSLAPLYDMPPMDLVSAWPSSAASAGRPVGPLAMTLITPATAPAVRENEVSAASISSREYSIAIRNGMGKLVTRYYLSSRAYSRTLLPPSKANAPRPFPIAGSLLAADKDYPVTLSYSPYLQAAVVGWSAGRIDIVRLDSLAKHAGVSQTRTLLCRAVGRIQAVTVIPVENAPAPPKRESSSTLVLRPSFVLAVDDLGVAALWAVNAHSHRCIEVRQADHRLARRVGGTPLSSANLTLLDNRERRQQHTRPMIAAHTVDAGAFDDQAAMATKDSSKVKPVSTPRAEVNARIVTLASSGELAVWRIRAAHEALESVALLGSNNDSLQLLPREPRKVGSEDTLRLVGEALNVGGTSSAGDKASQSIAGDIPKVARVVQSQCLPDGTLLVGLPCGGLERWQIPIANPKVVKERTSHTTQKSVGPKRSVIIQDGSTPQQTARSSGGVGSSLQTMGQSTMKSTSSLASERPAAVRVVSKLVEQVAWVNKPVAVAPSALHHGPVHTISVLPSRLSRDTVKAAREDMIVATAAAGDNSVVMWRMARLRQSVARSEQGPKRMHGWPEQAKLNPSKQTSAGGGATGLDVNEPTADLVPVFRVAYAGVPVRPLFLPNLPAGHPLSLASQLQSISSCVKTIRAKAAHVGKHWDMTRFDKLQALVSAQTDKAGTDAVPPTDWAFAVVAGDAVLPHALLTELQSNLLGRQAEVLSGRSGHPLLQWQLPEQWRNSGTIPPEDEELPLSQAPLLSSQRRVLCTRVATGWLAEPSMRTRWLGGPPTVCISGHAGLLMGRYVRPLHAWSSEFVPTPARQRSSWIRQSINDRLPKWLREGGSKPEPLWRWTGMQLASNAHDFKAPHASVGVSDADRKPNSARAVAGDDDPDVPGVIQAAADVWSRKQYPGPVKPIVEGAQRKHHAGPTLPRDMSMPLLRNPHRTAVNMSKIKPDKPSVTGLNSWRDSVVHDAFPLSSPVRTAAASPVRSPMWSPIPTPFATSRRPYSPPGIAPEINTQMEPGGSGQGAIESMTTLTPMSLSMLPTSPQHAADNSFGGGAQGDSIGHVMTVSAKPLNASRPTSPTKAVVPSPALSPVPDDHSETLSDAGAAIASAPQSPIPSSRAQDAIERAAALAEKHLSKGSGRSSSRSTGPVRLPTARMESFDRAQAISNEPTPRFDGKDDDSRPESPMEHLPDSNPATRRRPANVPRDLTQVNSRLSSRSDTSSTIMVPATTVMLNGSYEHGSTMLTQSSRRGAASGNSTARSRMTAVRSTIVLAASGDVSDMGSSKTRQRAGPKLALIAASSVPKHADISRPPSSVGYVPAPAAKRHNYQYHSDTAVPVSNATGVSTAVPTQHGEFAATQLAVSLSRAAAEREAAEQNAKRTRKDVLQARAAMRAEAELEHREAAKQIEALIKAGASKDEVARARRRMRARGLGQVWRQRELPNTLSQGRHAQAQRAAMPMGQVHGDTRGPMLMLSVGVPRPEDVESVDVFDASNIPAARKLVAEKLVNKELSVDASVGDDLIASIHDATFEDPIDWQKMSQQERSLELSAVLRDQDIRVMAAQAEVAFPKMGDLISQLPARKERLEAFTEWYLHAPGVRDSFILRNMSDALGEPQFVSRFWKSLPVEFQRSLLMDALHDPIVRRAAFGAGVVVPPLVQSATDPNQMVVLGSTEASLQAIDQGQYTDDDALTDAQFHEFAEWFLSNQTGAVRSVYLRGHLQAGTKELLEVAQQSEAPVSLVKLASALTANIPEELPRNPVQRQMPMRPRGESFRSMSEASMNDDVGASDEEPLVFTASQDVLMSAASSGVPESAIQSPVPFVKHPRTPSAPSSLSGFLSPFGSATDMSTGGITSLAPARSPIVSAILQSPPQAPATPTPIAPVSFDPTSSTDSKVAAAVAAASPSPTRLQRSPSKFDRLADQSMAKSALGAAARAGQTLAEYEASRRRQRAAVFHAARVRAHLHARQGSRARSTMSVFTSWFHGVPQRKVEGDEEDMTGLACSSHASLESAFSADLRPAEDVRPAARYRYFQTLRLRGAAMVLTVAVRRFLQSMGIVVGPDGKRRRTRERRARASSPLKPPEVDPGFENLHDFMAWPAKPIPPDLEWGQLDEYMRYLELCAAADCKGLRSVAKKQNISVPGPIDFMIVEERDEWMDIVEAIHAQKAAEHKQLRLKYKRSDHKTDIELVFERWDAFEAWYSSDPTRDIRSRFLAQEVCAAAENDDVLALYEEETEQELDPGDEAVELDMPMADPNAAGRWTAFRTWYQSHTGADGRSGFLDESTQRVLQYVEDWATVHSDDLRAQYLKLKQQRLEEMGEDSNDVGSEASYASDEEDDEDDSMRKSAKRLHFALHPSGADIFGLDENELMYLRNQAAAINGEEPDAPDGWLSDGSDGGCNGRKGRKKRGKGKNRRSRRDGESGDWTGASDFSDSDAAGGRRNRGRDRKGKRGKGKGKGKGGGRGRGRKGGGGSDEDGDSKGKRGGRKGRRGRRGANGDDDEELLSPRTIRERYEAELLRRVYGIGEDGEGADDDDDVDGDGVGGEGPLKFNADSLAGADGFDYRSGKYKGGTGLDTGDDAEERERLRQERRRLRMLHKMAGEAAARAGRKLLERMQWEVMSDEEKLAWATKEAYMYSEMIRARADYVERKQDPDGLTRQERRAREDAARAVFEAARAASIQRTVERGKQLAKLAQAESDARVFYKSIVPQAAAAGRQRLGRRQQVLDALANEARLMAREDFLSRVREHAQSERAAWWNRMEQAAFQPFVPYYADGSSSAPVLHPDAPTEVHAAAALEPGELAPTRMLARSLKPHEAATAALEQQVTDMSRQTRTWGSLRRSSVDASAATDRAPSGLSLADSNDESTSPLSVPARTRSRNSVGAGNSSPVAFEATGYDVELTKPFRKSLGLPPSQSPFESRSVSPPPHARTAAQAAIARRAALETSQQVQDSAAAQETTVASPPRLSPGSEEGNLAGEASFVSSADDAYLGDASQTQLGVTPMSSIMKTEPIAALTGDRSPAVFEEDTVSTTAEPAQLDDTEGGSPTLPPRASAYTPCIDQPSSPPRADVNRREIGMPSPIQMASDEPDASDHDQLTTNVRTSTLQIRPRRQSGEVTVPTTAASRVTATRTALQQVPSGGAALQLEKKSVEEPVNEDWLPQNRLRLPSPFASRRGSFDSKEDDEATAKPVAAAGSPTRRQQPRQQPGGRRQASSPVRPRTGGSATSKSGSGSPSAVRSSKTGGKGSGPSLRPVVALSGSSLSRAAKSSDKPALRGAGMGSDPLGLRQNGARKPPGRQAAGAANRNNSKPSRPMSASKIIQEARREAAAIRTEGLPSGPAPPSRTSPIAWGAGGDADLDMDMNAMGFGTITDGSATPHLFSVEIPDTATTKQPMKRLSRSAQLRRAGYNGGVRPAHTQSNPSLAPLPGLSSANTSSGATSVLQPGSGSLQKSGIAKSQSLAKLTASDPDRRKSTYRQSRDAMPAAQIWQLPTTEHSGLANLRTGEVGASTTSLKSKTGARALEAQLQAELRAAAAQEVKRAQRARREAAKARLSSMRRSGGKNPNNTSSAPRLGIAGQAAGSSHPSSRAVSPDTWDGLLEAPISLFSADTDLPGGSDPDDMPGRGRVEPTTRASSPALDAEDTCRTDQALVSNPASPWDSYRERGALFSVRQPNVRLAMLGSSKGPVPKPR